MNHVVPFAPARLIPWVTARPRALFDRLGECAFRLLVEVLGPCGYGRRDPRFVEPPGPLDFAAEIHHEVARISSRIHNRPVIHPDFRQHQARVAARHIVVARSTMLDRTRHGSMRTARHGARQ